MNSSKYPKFLLLGVATLLLPVHAVSADSQVVTAEPSALFASAGESVTLRIIYSTDNNNQSLTGLGLRIHFDSSKLAWGGTGAVYGNGWVGEDFEPVADTEDYDQNPATDMYYGVSWVSLAGQWPGELPVTLLEVQFDVPGDLAEMGETQVNFTASSTAAGYDLQVGSATIEVGF